MSAASGPPDGDRLDAWKEIAGHLGREARTVQGWEKTEGLPVHRHLHLRQGSVYAFKSELDAWREARRGIPEAAARSEGAESPPEEAPTGRRVWMVAGGICGVAVLALASFLIW